MLITISFYLLSLSLPITQDMAYAQEERFGGVGISVAQIFDPDVDNKMGSLVVLDVIEGTPASAQDIRRGDIISQIDGEPTKGKMFEYLIVKKLRGLAGSEVKLLIERPGVKTPVNVILIRSDMVYSPEKEK